MLSSWVSRRNGGVFEAVVAQAELLQALGAVPVVLGLRDEESAADAWRLVSVETHLADRYGPAALAFSPDLNEALSAAGLDLLHLHGIWQYPTNAAGDWANGIRKPLVISPHGMLDPWITSRNAWKKHLARFLWERSAWHSASAFHALTEAEARDIADESGGAPTAVIPNPAPPLTARDWPRGPNVLYLGRIHEKKNISGLIEGWLLARPDLPADATLTIAGWGDDTGLAQLEQAMAGQRDTGIEFVGTAFGSQKAALFDLARFLVLPSFSEGLPMAILESWAAGVPAIMSQSCHLPDGFEVGAALECGTDPGSIRDALVRALGLPDDEWSAMSSSARDLATGQFSAQTVAARWEALYAALLQR